MNAERSASRYTIQEHQSGVSAATLKEQDHAHPFHDHLFCHAGRLQPRRGHPDIPGQYPTIQQAIDAAVDGDVVRVDPGTYVENIDFKGKAITVESTGGPDVTVIDGGQAGSVISIPSLTTSGPVLDGFTITNGTGTPDLYGAYRYGYGIYCKGAAPLIQNNVITKNVAPAFPTGGLGIGVYFEQSVAQLHNNVISDNGSP